MCVYINVQAYIHNIYSSGLQYSVESVECNAFSLVVSDYLGSFTYVYIYIFQNVYLLLMVFKAFLSPLYTFLKTKTKTLQDGTLAELITQKQILVKLQFKDDPVHKLIHHPIYSYRTAYMHVRMLMIICYVEGAEIINQIQMWLMLQTENKLKKLI